MGVFRESFGEKRPRDIGSALYWDGINSRVPAVRYWLRAPVHSTEKTGTFSDDNHHNQQRHSNLCLLLTYRQTSNISRTESQNLIVSRLVLKLRLRNLLKSGAE